jgi:hypothetical protein
MSFAMSTVPFRAAACGDQDTRQVQFTDRRFAIAGGTSLARLFVMANKDRNRKNQPPTGQGKDQSPYRGEPRKLGKRSEGPQAQRGHPELNLGDTGEEAAAMDGDQRNPARPKAGR